MFAKLLLLFTIVPLIEIYILIKVGQHIGALDTIMLVLLTGLFGAWMARSQGLIVLRKIQTDLHSGQLPAESLTDALIILIGGVLLITPGLITDCTGLLLLFPQSRRAFRKFITSQFKKYIAKNNVYTNIHFDDLN